MQTYKEWMENADSFNTIQVNRSSVRDSYKFPYNVIVFETTVLPWSIFKKNYAYVWLDLVLPSDNEIIKSILEKNGGKMNFDLYTNEGYYTPEFNEVENLDSPMERAYSFVFNLKESNII